MPKREDREKSQRASPEERLEEADKAELARQIKALQRELAIATSYRNSADRRVHELEVQPPPKPDVNRKIKKIKSKTQFYEHVEELCVFLRAFEPADIAPLVATALGKLTKDLKVDLLWSLMQTKAFRKVRQRITAIRDAEIAKHLRDKVYTPAHFALLRLVGNLSKRVCSLTEQSIKWVHNADGTKKRQMLAPDSSQPAPPIFDLAGIQCEECEAEKDSKLTLRDHADRRGADICGKPYAIDRAMLDSVQQMSRAGARAVEPAPPSRPGHPSYSVCSSRARAACRWHGNGGDQGGPAQDVRDGRWCGSERARLGRARCALPRLDSHAQPVLHGCPQLALLP